MVRLLVDDGVLDGSARALPLSWLQGFDIATYPARRLGDWLTTDPAETLLLRSVTRLTAAEVERLPQLRAVATLSSGTDHIDEAALAARGIALHTGRGGNAAAVAQWTQWALAQLWQTDPVLVPVQASFARRRILVVGVGAVGSIVASHLEQLGATILLCDPPRAEREPGFVSIDLDTALAMDLDALTLHVPLTQTGPHATANLLNQSRIQSLRGAVLLGAARGGVLDEDAASIARRDKLLRGFALDTFAGEPNPRPEVLSAADVATPHIAGHTIEGKLRVAALALGGLRRAVGLAAVDLQTEIRNAMTILQPHGAFEALDAAQAALRAGMPFDTVRHSHVRGEAL